MLSFNRQLTVSLASERLSFVSPSNELPSRLLLAQGTNKKVKRKRKKTGDQVDVFTCSEDPNAAYAGDVTVLLVLSQCLNNTALGIVETWANEMKAIVSDVVGGQNGGVSLTFEATMVAGDCGSMTTPGSDALLGAAGNTPASGNSAPASSSSPGNSGNTPAAGTSASVTTTAPATTAPPTTGASPGNSGNTPAAGTSASVTTTAPATTAPPTTGASPGNSGNTPAADRSALLLNQDVPLSQLARLNAFPGLGQGLSLASVASASDAPTAVISFATGDTSYSEILLFEDAMELLDVLNFQMGDNCADGVAICIKLKQTEDVFMYNPFTVTHALSCSELEDGVPVTLIDDDGTRKCFCGCPAGSELQTTYDGQKCVQLAANDGHCVWSQVHGYKHQVGSEVNVCSLDGISTKWGIPVPLPTSGYASNEPRSTADGLEDPRVALSVVRVQDPEYYAGYLSTILGTSSSSWPFSFSAVVDVDSRAADINPTVPGSEDVTVHDAMQAWKDYQSNRKEAVDSLVFSEYGKYRLAMDAYDYYSSATCVGCLVLVDNYRPHATSKCPAQFCDSASNTASCNGTAELTIANVATANGLIQQYFEFGDQVENDGCSGNNRCDLHQFSKQNFFDSKFARFSHDEGISCFDYDLVLGDFLSSPKAKVNPLKLGDNSCHNVANPVSAGQCTRCCKLSTALREWWTDYRCGSDYDARYCEGDSDQVCAFQQCLVMNGDTLATVTAHIQPDVTVESERVLQHLPQEGGYQTVTQVHRALECTAFGETDGDCDFTAKLSELVDTTQAFNLDLDAANAVENYVFWRYKVDGDSEKWRLWKTGQQEVYGQTVFENDDPLTFAVPETKIAIEAWTQCGLVRRFFFYVQLHVNSAVDVCAQFGEMWYQTSVSRLSISTSMCAYPGSDFAELTFDFHPNVGLQYSRTALRMNVSEVVCTGTLENRSAVEILKVTSDSPEIVTRFAVEMLQVPMTEAVTNFAVTCDFKYLQYGGFSRTKTCERAFSIADCKGPEFDSLNAECQYDACAGNEKAGLYEACGGTLVKSSATATYVETGEKECCQGCGDTTVTCTGLLNVPQESANIMRCEPTSVANAYSGYYFMLAQATEQHATALSLLGGGALIAAVAFAIVRRRVADSRTAESEAESYYQLLH
ncbi:hypothetical protein BBJ28_00005412 [Nothophytophthora sp. Chile5]|nr:hypothetical protein BBJ28_00005412 [Nothophytophthora sp. Chile5]